MGDVGDEQSVAATVDRVEAELGPLGIVVNNAGITRDNVVMLMSPDEFDGVVRTHLRGTFLVSKAAARKMLRRREGSIVNISSVVGRRGNAGQANYAAAKAGIIGLTKSLAKELGARSIRVNAVAPGYIDTAMTQALPDDVKQAIVDNTPLKSIGAAVRRRERRAVSRIAALAIHYRVHTPGRRRSRHLTFKATRGRSGPADPQRSCPT